MGSSTDNVSITFLKFDPAPEPPCYIFPFEKDTYAPLPC